MTDKKSANDGNAMPEGASAPDTPAEAPVRHMRPCPVCSKLSTPEFYPFCSDRCAKVDLHRWLAGSYSIPAVEDDDEDQE